MISVMGDIQGGVPPCSLRDGIGVAPVDRHVMAIGFHSAPGLRRRIIAPRLGGAGIHYNNGPPQIDARSKTMADPNKTRGDILTRTYRVKGDIEFMPRARGADYNVEAKGFY